MIQEAELAPSYPRPIGEPGPGGMRTELHWCSRHKREYIVGVIPFGFPADLTRSGQCEECKTDAEWAARAREILPKRSQDVTRRLIELMDGCEDEITRRTEEQIAAYVEELRPQLEQALRTQYAETLQARAEVEILREIEAELRRASA